MAVQPAVGPSGAQLFARYAYPPNELGYCGPADSAGLLSGASQAADAEIARRARAFDGAWVYLELIAEFADIADPLDRRVVEAYWLGSDLMTSVDGDWLAARLKARLRASPGGQWSGEINGIDAGARAHHAFHVFAVYPWVGLLQGSNDTARSILDQCRIRTAVVTAVDGPRATVELGRLSWDGRRLEVGPTELAEVRWSQDGKSLLDVLEVGDRVSVHWDWVCDVLTADQAAAVEAYEQQQLDVTNQALSRLAGRTAPSS